MCIFQMVGLPSVNSINPPPNIVANGNANVNVSNCYPYPPQGSNIGSSSQIGVVTLQQRAVTNPNLNVLQTPRFSTTLNNSVNNSIRKCFQ